MNCGIVWLRRDLRLHDNVALHEAVASGRQTYVAFVLDPAILKSERTGAPIVQAFFDALAGLRAALREAGGDLTILEGDPVAAIPAFARRAGADCVFYNADYEPHAIERDARVGDALDREGIAHRAHVDHVYFGGDEVEQHTGAPYRVYTPYRNRWLEQRHVAPRTIVPSHRRLSGHLVPPDATGSALEVPTPESRGFHSSDAYPRVNESTARTLLRRFLRDGGLAERYQTARNEPALDATSHLSPHLRAGTIGIRECVESAFEAAGEHRGPARTSIMAWIGELIWRDFYQMILKRFPHVVSEPFLENANKIPWRDAPNEFERWCEGRTGYPIVDAAMRQLNSTGWMHNRLRMVVASFLTKDLLIDWRCGERYFERQLADADVAANNGGWQWAASTGTDAAPYFRIFNPVRQGTTFDPSGTFVRRMLPELRDVPDRYVHEPWKMSQPPAGYPSPMVDHAQARTRALAAFEPVFRGAAMHPRG